MIYDRSSAYCHGITGLGHAELGNCTDITGLQLSNLDGILTSQDIQLADLLFCIFVHVINGGIWF